MLVDVFTIDLSTKTQSKLFKLSSQNMLFDSNYVKE